MNLTTEQIIKLKEQHKATRDKKVCDRIKAVLLINKGYNYNEIAEILLLDDTTIRRHIAEYLEQEKLNNNHNGYNGKLTKIQCDELIAYLQKNTYTDVRPVIHYVLTRYKMYFSRSGMNAWLQQHGFRYKRPHLVPSKHNPAKQQGFIDEITPIMASGVPLYSLDASHPSHQSKSTHGWIFVGENKALKTTATQKRVHLFGALNMHSQEVAVIEAETINSQAVIALIEQIKTKHNSSEKIHFILDNAKYQKSFIIQEYLAQNTNIIFHYLPAYSPNLNLIERVWKFMHKKVTNNQYYEHYAGFKQAIISFFENIHQYENELKTLLTFRFQKLDYATANFAK